LRRNQALVGRRVEVLIEGQGADGRVYGRTRQNRIVWSNRPADPGTVVDLEVTAATAWQLTAG
jgi:tRNA A37 methylthiotransferase MiaB